MNELDNWYKNNINNQKIPPYQESHWTAVSAFIARAERMRKLKLLERGIFVFLLAFVAISYFFNATNYKNEKLGNSTIPMADVEIIKEKYASEFARESSSTQNDNTDKQNEVVREQEDANYAVSNKLSSDKDRMTNQSANEANSWASNIKTKDIGEIAQSNSNGMGSIESSPRGNLPDKDPDQEAIFKNMPELLAVDARPSQVSAFSEVSLLPSLNPVVLREGAASLVVLNEFWEMSFDADLSHNRPYFRKSLSLGMPFSVNSGVDGGKWMGGNISLQAEYHFNSDWMLSAGIGYAIRRGPVGIIHDHPTSEYSFEMRDRGHWMTIDELHYVSIPVSIHYTFKKVGLGVGYRPLGLVNARAVVSEYNHHRSFSDQGVILRTETTNEQKGWARPTGLRRFTHELTGMVSYEISSNWRAAASLAYNPMGNTDEGFGLKYSDVIGDYHQAYQVSRPFQAQSLFAELTIQYIW